MRLLTVRPDLALQCRLPDTPYSSTHSRWFPRLLVRALLIRSVRSISRRVQFRVLSGEEPAMFMLRSSMSFRSELSRTLAGMDRHLVFVPSVTLSRSRRRFLDIHS